MTAAIGAMCSAIRRASSATTSRATGSPARAAAKIERGSYGGSSTVAGRRALRASRERRRARVDVLGEADARVVELARRAVPAAVQLAAQHEPGAEAGADRDEDEVVDAARDAAPLLAERGEVDVVLDRHRQSEPLRELAREAVALEPGHVRRERDARRLALDGARHAEHDAVDRARLDAAAASNERVEQRDRVERRGCASRSGSSTSWRARISPVRSQIAPRTKRAPRSRPSTNAASGTGSKKTAP